MASNYASEWDKPKYEPPKGFVELLTDLRSMYEEKDGIWYHDNIQGIRRIFDYLETEKGLREFLEYLKAFCLSYIHDYSKEQFDWMISNKRVDASIQRLLNEDVEVWLKTYMQRKINGTLTE